MRRSVIGPIIATSILVGGLGAAGWAVYQAGVRSGLAETASEVIVQRPGFSGFGLFFGFIFMLFFLSIISKMFFFRRWRHHGPKTWSEGEGSPMERRMHEWHEKQHGEPGRRYRSDEPDST